MEIEWLKSQLQTHTPAPKDIAERTNAGTLVDAPAPKDIAGHRYAPAPGDVEGPVGEQVNIRGPGDVEEPRDVEGPVEIEPMPNLAVNCKLCKILYLTKLSHFKANDEPTLSINNFCCFTFTLKSSLTLLSQTSFYHRN